MERDRVAAEIRAGEGLRLEFKREAVPVEEFARELAAFGNAEGGMLIVGVADDGSIRGLEASEADHVQRLLDDAARTRVKPAIQIRIDRHVIEGKTVTVAEVPPTQPGRPFLASSKYLIRVGSKVREMEPAELQRVMVATSPVSPDELPVVGARHRDLNEAAIAELVATARVTHDPERTLRALKLVLDDGTPTLAGVLVLSDEVAALLPEARISAVRYEGTKVSRALRDHKELRLRLPKLVDAAVEFIERHTPSPAVIEGTKRKSMGVPTEVWREAIVNALCHRDYQIASQTRVYVFDDRVEVRSPGVLPNRLSLDGVREGVTVRRNPYLAGAMARLGYMDSLGLGVPSMLASLDEIGLREPRLELVDTEFRLTVWTQP